MASESEEAKYYAAYAQRERALGFWDLCSAHRQDELVRCARGLADSQLAALHRLVEAEQIRRGASLTDSSKETTDAGT